MSIQSAPADFELLLEGEIWVATHIETGAASQGDTPNEAVALAQEAARLQQESPSPGDDDYQRAMLERFDIDPEEVSISIDSLEGVP